jgi:hypothetical protein
MTWNLAGHSGAPLAGASGRSPAHRTPTTRQAATTLAPRGAIAAAGRANACAWVARKRQTPET